jgi:urease accessory protein
VLVVQACKAHGTPLDLLRAAYHLGNRHVQLDVRADRLLLEPDHVLVEMLRGNHLVVTEAQAAFEPEGGAYATAGHGHAHHAHDHDHDHDHGHGHDHDHAAGHKHGHDHKHDH